MNWSTGKPYDRDSSIIHAVINDIRLLCGSDDYLADRWPIDTNAGRQHLSTALDEVTCEPCKAKLRQRISELWHGNAV